MIELCIRHLAVLTLAGLVSLFLRKRSAAVRHALWSVALALILLLPLLQRVPITLPAMLSASSLELQSEEKETSREGIGGVVVSPRTSLVSVPATLALTPEAGPRWESYGALIYVFVALALVVRWGIGWGLAVRLARRGKPLGRARGISVVQVDGVGPLTFGWPRGVILVPDAGFSSEKLVLRHEVAHVQRADFLWQALASLVCALWWFSPAVWLAARELRREAERACDDIVLSQGVFAPDYADCLLEVASMKPLSLPFAASLVSLAQKSALASRIAALLAPERDRRPVGLLAVLGIGALLLPAGLALTRPAAADAPVPALIRPASAPSPAEKVRLPRPSSRTTPQAIGTTSLVAPKIAPATSLELVPTPPAVGLEPKPASLPILSRLFVRSPEAPVASVEKPLPLVGSLFTRPATTALSVPDVAGDLAGKKIVLDPGHGGMDKGAPGGGLYEANLNLAIATKAAELLRKQGATVTLTRDSDTFVELSKRATFSANQDLFLSIHIDSSAQVLPASNRPFTIKVFYHGKVDAEKTTAAMKLMKALFEPVFPDPSPAPKEPQKPRPTPEKTSGLEVTATREESWQGTVAPDSKVLPSGFLVLRNAKCPAYLIDFGNISHEEDVAKFKAPKFLDRLAQGIVEGARQALSAPASGTATGGLRVPLRFLSASDLVAQLQPMIEKGGALVGASAEAVDADNSIVLQGTPDAVMQLKSRIALMDVKLRVVNVKVCEVRENKPGSYYVISTANNTKAHLLSSGGITSSKVEVIPHLNGDGKTVLLQLTMRSEKPVFKRIPLGEETKLETPFGIYLVTITEEKDGTTHPK